MWGIACLLILLFATGCASRRTPLGGGSGAATRPLAGASDPKAELLLDEIEPVPTLGPPGVLSTTQPMSAQAPLESVELFARARGAMLDNQRFTAIRFLQQAVAIDPNSFELHYALGEAHLGRSLSNTESIQSFETAAELRPDHLEVHLQLGRQYLSRNNLDNALYHLRLALQTSDYQNNDGMAAVADFFLARALQQAGYLRAATDRYRALVARVDRPTLAIRGNPELAYLISRPALLHIQIGELYERRGKHEQALAAYERADAAAGGQLEIRARVIHTLVSLGRDREAMRQAADAVREHGANPQSLDLLREIYQRLGREADVEAELRRLHDEQPADRGILFALVNVLVSTGQDQEAEDLLLAQLLRDDIDIELTRKTFDFYDERHETKKAAVLLISVLARRPEMLRDLSPMWSQLIRPAQKNRLRLADLQDLNVPADAEASRLFWVSRIAEMWNRDALARSALERSVALDPPFPPAYRVLVSDYWSRPELDDAAKTQRSQELIDRAREVGNEPLALEIAGIMLLNQDKPAEAVDTLARAVKAGDDPSPDLQLLYASALLAQGKENRSEQVLWKVISDHPTCEDAYAALFRTYMNSGSVDQAVKVLQTWLSADPTSISARLLQATIYVQARQLEYGERILNRLLNEHNDNAEVLGSLEVFYQQTGRMDQYIDKLEKLRRKQPTNQALAQQLIQIYVTQNRLGDAMTVLEETRAAAATDPDLLYHVAHMYTAVDEAAMSEQVLQDVLTLDPSHAPASNDLGYTWADQGKNLKRAEELIRVAVDVEPDNQSFLDSLGWVLYKRGRFDEARQHLEAAVGPATFPDPVVLDHLGDVLYRLGRSDEARSMWQRSLDGLKRTGAQREDLRQLRLTLDKKIDQVQKGEPVNVAPIVEAEEGMSRQRAVGSRQ